MPPLTFLNSLFLAGLAAAALPILIHLFSKRRAKEVRFPSLEFLQEVSRKKVRRLQLRQILLLVLRVLIIGLFALAAPLLEVVHRHPCVVLWLTGHRHIHRITPRPGAAGGFWEITTASIIDWPSDEHMNL